MDLKQRAKQLKSDIPAIFLALRDKETPLLAKIVAAITVAYALSPIDLIPDVIPVLGYLDDLIILPALVAVTIKLIPWQVYERSRDEAEHLWKSGKPKKWFYAIPVVIVWAVVFCLAAKWIYSMRAA